MGERWREQESESEREREKKGKQVLISTMGEENQWVKTCVENKKPERERTQEEETVRKQEPRCSARLASSQPDPFLRTYYTYKGFQKVSSN